MSDTGPPDDYTDQLKEAAHEVLSMTDIVERLLDFENEGVTSSDRFHLREEAAAEIGMLRLLLQNLVSDILEYERINKLAPFPGKQDCWQSVTEARRALEPKP